MTTRVFVLLGSILLASCVSEDKAAPPAANLTLESWVQKALPSGNEIACQKSHEGDYFFVTKPTDGTVKVGSRLDATEAGKKRTSFTFLSEWFFFNEDGHPIQTSDPPQELARQSATPDAPFTVNVSSYRLQPGNFQTLKVSVWVKECLSTTCDRLEKKGPDESEYKLEVCDIALSPPA